MDALGLSQCVEGVDLWFSLRPLGRSVITGHRAKGAHEPPALLQEPLHLSRKGVSWPRSKMSNLTMAVSENV